MYFVGVDFLLLLVLVEEFLFAASGLQTGHHAEIRAHHLQHLVEVHGLLGRPFAAGDFLVRQA